MLDMNPTGSVVPPSQLVRMCPGFIEELGQEGGPGAGAQGEEEEEEMDMGQVILLSNNTRFIKT